MPDRISSCGPAEVKRGFGVYSHGQMHYRITVPEQPGRMPLMCLHMSPSSSRVYERLLSYLGTDRIGIAPDTPGFGESDPPPYPLEISDFAKANFGLLDQFGIADSVAVLGYHTGSLTACEMARQQPRRVRRLILISAPLFSETGLEQLKRAYAPKEVSEDGGHLTAIWRELRTWSDERQSLEDTMEHFAKHLRGGSRSAWGVQAAFDYKLQETLPLLFQPLLLLNPEDDLHENSRQAASLIRNGRVHELPRCSHSFLDIATEEVAALIRQFLDE